MLRILRRPPPPDKAEVRAPHICVVGPGVRFLSGISYYTYGLASALARRGPVSVILLRELLPKRLYPGAARVGQPLSDLALPAEVDSFSKLDWFWIPSLFQALAFLRRRHDVLLLQWWTGTVLHTYLALAAATRLLGGRVIIEFHEALDTGEDRLPWVRRYVKLLVPLLFGLADRYVVHSEFDRRLVSSRFDLPDDRIDTIPHATVDHYGKGGSWREAPEDCCNLLFFGVIRPFKGLEDLIQAFGMIPEPEIKRYWLTVVGETWEGWTAPNELIAASPYRDRITFINRYVTDAEVSALFGGADVVVLPYHRSSQSGPLHVAMQYGLPIVVSAVGGLVEAVKDYQGAILTPPANRGALLVAVDKAAGLRGRRFTHRRGWSQTVEAYATLFDRLPRRRSLRPHRKS
jgi:glycosyltransferase involved in cell wall biosynthesis